MDTAAPVSATWIPEDDLLLKNAIEAGASLEALAKGAVKFSRRFTYKELRDRWHSLLYDPDVSAQASARMFELELSGFAPSTKSIRSENFKAHKEFPEKRKRRSIRKEYYAMRKKFRNEFFSSNDLGFLDEPNLHDCHAHGADYGEPQDGNFISDNLGLQEEDLDILCNVFPETIGDFAASSALGGTNDAYPVECADPIEDDYPNGILRKYEFPSDVSTSLRQDDRVSSVPDIKCLDISHTLKDSVPNFGERTAVKESGLVQVPPGKRLFKSSEKKQLSSFDSADDNPQNVCCGFGASQHFSPNSEGNSPLQAMEFPSPQPNLPLWKTMQDLSAPSMPVGMSGQDTTRDAERMHPDDGAGKGESSSVFDIVHSGPFLGVEQHTTDYVNSSAVSDGDFADLSDSLLNLSNEDEMPFMDVDVKDTVDRTSYDNVNSILQNSPEAFQEENIVKLEPEIMMGAETCTKVLNDVNPTKTEINPSSPHTDQRNVCHLEVIVPSTSGMSSESRELDSGIMCCTLNTEDPEIPCNDDIFLLIHPSTAFASSTTPPFNKESMDPASAVDGKVNEQGLNFSIKGKDSSRSFPWPQKVGTSCSLETRLAHPLLGCAAKSELPDTNRLGVLPGNANKAPGDSSHSRLSHSISNKSTDKLPEEDVTRAQLRGGDTPASLAEMPKYAEAGLLKVALPEPAINISVSDSDESQSDDDVPYFSDIEAMILEMDLDPPEQDSSITRQGSRYQYEETKRTIIRLEQCARSCLQRTLTSQGAFAILYGRHLKHYIRKTEVVIGRSTDDIDVDIDLRKEGRANKVSRRQVIIKMDADGCFSLKNIGKSAVSVNGKPVVTGQSLILSSSCLIEIRGMSFVFEINQKYVRRYLDGAARKSNEKNNKFDWSPEGIS